MAWTLFPVGARHSSIDIALALEEEDARRRGQAPDLLHGQDHRTIDHAVDQETVLARVDVGNTAAVDLVVERRWRDDPQRFVQGREAAAASRPSSTGGTSP